MPRYSPLEYRGRKRPIWCPGCGDYGVLSALYGALSRLDVDPKGLVIVSGIGCSGRLPDFVKAYGFHGAHGRALPVTQGIKVANPDLMVFAVGGDGDGLSIGGGHFPHIARRNIDVTYIIMDNAIYGMTKGQYSPTSPLLFETGSSPYGALDEPINPIALAIAYDASFVARAYVGPKWVEQLIDLIIQAVRHRGFSFIQVLSPCVTFNALQTYQSLNEMVTEIGPDHDSSDRARAFELALNTNNIYLGVFYKAERPTFEDRVKATMEKAGKTQLDMEQLFYKFV